MIEVFREQFEHRHDYAKDWQKRIGGKVMGYFCTYAPEEIIYAAGMLPYSLRDAYIYERLISYRHNSSISIHELKRSADYVHIIAPVHGTVEEQLPKSRDSYSLISSHQLYLDGLNQECLVFYDSNPEHYPLESRIGSR